MPSRRRVIAAAGAAAVGTLAGCTSNDPRQTDYNKRVTHLSGAQDAFVDIVPIVRIPRYGNKAEERLNDINIELTMREDVDRVIELHANRFAGEQSFENRRTAVFQLGRSRGRTLSSIGRTFVAFKNQSVVGRQFVQLWDYDGGLLNDPKGFYKTGGNWTIDIIQSGDFDTIAAKANLRRLALFAHYDETVKSPSRVTVAPPYGENRTVNCRPNAHRVRCYTEVDGRDGIWRLRTNAGETDTIVNVEYDGLL